MSRDVVVAVVWTVVLAVILAYVIERVARGEDDE